jgi:hypothetical protein
MAPTVAPEQQPPQGQQATTLGNHTPTASMVDANPLAPPPPPMDKVRGKLYPKQDAPAGEKLEYLRRMIQQTDAEHLARAKQLAYHTLIANGKQHVSWSNRSRRWEETPLVENETRVTLNYVRAILRARTNRLLPKNFDWQAVPDSNDYDARDNAKVAERFLGQMRDRTQLLRVADAALELAYCGGVSFVKSFWNPTIGAPRPAQLQFTEDVEAPVMDPDTGQPFLDYGGQPIMAPQPTPVLRYVDETGQPVMDDDPAKAYWYRPGDTDIALRTLFTVRWNPDALGWAPADGLRWLMDQEAVPLAVARERYPDFAEKIAVSGDAQSALTYQRMASLAAMKSPDRTNPSIAATATPEEYTTITEYWELPSDYFKNGRLIVFVGDCEVGDGEFPDGVFPFEPIYDEPVPLSPGGRGVVTDLVAPQQIVNEVFASFVAVARLQGLGQWIGPNFPGMPELVTHQMGAILRVPKGAMALAGNNIRNVIAPLEHAPIPGDRMMLFEMARETMYQVGAFHEITRGQTPPGVDSGVAVRALAEREDGQLMRSKTALENAMVNIGRTQLKIAKAKYAPGDERWIPVDRPDLGYQVESVDGAKLPDPERLLLSVSGFSPRSQDELRADIKEAMLNGWLTPAQGLKALDLGRGVESAFVSEQRHYARARRINLMLEQGKAQQVPLMYPGTQEPIINPDTFETMTQVVDDQGMRLCLDEIDDHVMHMSTLEELLLDLSKPVEVRQVAMALWTDHRDALMQSAPSPTPEASVAESESSAGNGDPSA